MCSFTFYVECDTELTVRQIRPFVKKEKIKANFMMAIKMTFGKKDKANVNNGSA